VPDVYFRLGERISHFLIDEFQDTSPVQWKNLFPLIENALSQGGSFFAVGDTKQSIYGFRNADFRIMKSLECSNPFPSARFVTGELDLNYRSRPAILDFTERIFKVNLKSYSDLHTAGEMSGLTSFHQKALSEREGQGIVESALIEKRPGTAAEREWVYSRIERLRSKGFRYREMALLTQTNEQSVQAAAWLSETGIPFISYSSLDIRRRKSIRELLALIRFLINPMDHFALSAFLLGDIFSAFLREGAPDNPPERIRKFLLDERDRFPLYKRFQEEFGNLWETCFESLFKVAGFLPLYDLTSEIYAVFSVFSRFPEEEAALIKFLEVIRKFEWRGSGQSGEFLIQAEEDEAGSEEWNLSVPRDLESVHVMTVHKAKGLEFPAVILLLYETKNRGFDYIVEEAGKGIRLLRINRNESRCDPGLHELYEAEKIREWVNRLNALYVGLTRPAKELHVLGVANRKEAFPFNIIPEVTPAERDFVRPVPESRENFGSISARPVQHRSRRLAIPFQKVDEHSLSERKRGEFLHAVIGQIEYLNGNGESQLQESVDRLIRAGEPPRGTDRLVKLLARFLNRPDVSGYFAPRPGRRIYREMELLDSKGQLYRPDRVIVDAESVTVIDFKSGKGGKKAGPAGEQVRNYLTLVRDIFPGKPARGLVASIDLNHVEEVT
jgi:superfamily I DNA/RNA helicase